MSKRLLIAGGGTGGHVLAGVAVAQEWVRVHGKEAEILFVGARGGIEERLVPKAGFSLELVEIGSLNRVSWSKRIKTLWSLPFAFVKSARILTRFKPDVVLGVGGYASGPVVLLAGKMSKLYGIKKTAVLEHNAILGFTNRQLAEAVDVVFGAYGELKSQLPQARVEVTGCPVRSGFVKLPLPHPEPFTILAFGGSQGALGMNTLILEALPHLKGARIRWIHQTGTKDLERVRSGHGRAGTDAQVVEFIDDMKSAYARANLVICRSGASTLAELAAVGRAAILVPLPTAADDHQRRNALAVRDSGAAWICEQGRSDGSVLASQIREVIANPKELIARSEKAFALAKPNAAKHMVEILS